MSGNGHSYLSPSAAHRWLRCAASPRLESLRPLEDDKGSAYAEEGTLAHALCARDLKRRLGVSTAAEDTEIEELGPDYDVEEAALHARDYADFVWSLYQEARGRDKGARLAVEQRLDMGEWADGCFGTSDAIVVERGQLHVVDFKYGMGVRVEAAGNPQMRLYALGALGHFSDWDVRRIHTYIVQPRMDNYSQETMTAAELEAWGGAVLREAAAAALRGDGPAVPGSWCKFCKARFCTARAAMALALFDRRGEMTPEEIAAEVLPRLKEIRDWTTAVEEETLRRAMKGERFPGYKVVSGSARRVIEDEAELVARLLGAGYTREQIMSEPKLRAITAIERMTGKAVFQTLSAGCMGLKEGAPKLVPESDRRRPLDPAAVFGDIAD